MNDQAAWEQAVSAAGSWYLGLPPDTRTTLDGLIKEIMQLKQQLVELVTSSGSSAACRSCGGECCLLGKYHVSVLDVLAYRNTGFAPVAPDFSTNPACPYSDSSGCLMTPRYRPVTCVIFNCQLIEDRLTPAERETLHEHERCLRDAVKRAVHTSGTRIDRPLLLSCR
ncbi:MAG: hypothetical protein IPQ16_13940 [Geobacteraceae bacterium]|nr:hypothetical protein [Geobacteraceae bacterium]